MVIGESMEVVHVKWSTVASSLLERVPSCYVLRIGYLALDFLERRLWANTARTSMPKL